MIYDDHQIAQCSSIFIFYTFESMKTTKGNHWKSMLNLLVPFISIEYETILSMKINHQQMKIIRTKQKVFYVKISKMIMIDKNDIAR